MARGSRQCRCGYIALPGIALIVGLAGACVAIVYGNFARLDVVGALNALYLSMTSDINMWIEIFEIVAAVCLLFALVSLGILVLAWRPRVIRGSDSVRGPAFATQGRAFMITSGALNTVAWVVLMLCMLGVVVVMVAVFGCGVAYVGTQVAVNNIQPVWSTMQNLVDTVKNATAVLTAEDGPVVKELEDGITQLETQLNSTSSDAAKSIAATLVTAWSKQTVTIPNMSNSSAPGTQVTIPMFQPGSLANISSADVQTVLQSMVLELQKALLKVVQGIDNTLEDLLLALSTGGCPVICIDLSGLTWLSGPNNNCICNLFWVQEAGEYLWKAVWDLVVVALALVVAIAGLSWLMLHTAAQYGRVVVRRAVVANGEDYIAGGVAKGFGGGGGDGGGGGGEALPPQVGAVGPYAVANGGYSMGATADSRAPYV